MLLFRKKTSNQLCVKKQYQYQYHIECRVLEYKRGHATSKIIECLVFVASITIACHLSAFVLTWVGFKQPGKASAVSTDENQ